MEQSISVQDFRQIFENALESGDGEAQSAALIKYFSRVGEEPDLVLIEDFLLAPGFSAFDTLVQGLLIKGSALCFAFLKKLVQDTGRKEQVRSALNDATVFDLLMVKFYNSSKAFDAGDRQIKNSLLVLVYLAAMTKADKAYKAMEGCLKLDDPDIVSLCAFHLLQSGGNYLNPLLIVLKTSSSEVRNAVLKAFMKKPVPNMISPLVNALDIADTETHELIMGCLRGLKDFIYESIKSMISEQGDAVRDNARKAADGVLGSGSFDRILEDLKKRSLDGKKTLLIVDDQVYIRKALQYSLKKYFEVFLAANGLEAIKIARQIKPTLILMDTMMPIMDGITATREMKQIPEVASIPIIMLTARAAKNHVIEAVKAGISDYIVKPYSIEIVLEKINKVLGTNLTND
ncbi:MAG: hypothetical protein CVV64_05295 [Candidatus Wallbacteria bacterium HGW-Wallbacteria-1]|jgi:two-component system alkaline phosphatase synthesis response regulator PhoP|uniref:Response regulatory domain-containing protein n=1 Tax=Candidatus Wallbacteria bacterium HGW-Wallbacteria-1 TaxID=2013854 RepID=A0A2N1PS78_9BACT|nr:MAG: hypothetical protein CVV64_05295 [Candidatus Wallbacteria bacterium HGW-Wallbacteria-1]